MLIDKFGNIDYEVKGVYTTKNNIMLGENQFFQWTNTGKRLELWEGKKEYLNYEFDHDVKCKIRRITYWNQNSVYGFFNKEQFEEVG